MSSMWHTTLDRVEQQLDAMVAEFAASNADTFQNSSQWLQRIAQALVEWSSSDDARHSPPDSRALQRLHQVHARLGVLRQALAQRQSRLDGGLALLVPSAAAQRGPTYGAHLTAAGGVRRSPYQSATQSSGTWATTRA